MRVDPPGPGSTRLDRRLIPLNWSKLPVIILNLGGSSVYPYRIEVSHPQDHRPTLTPKLLRDLVEATVRINPATDVWSIPGYPRYLLHFATVPELWTAASALAGADLLIVAIVPSPEFDARLAELEREMYYDSVTLAGYDPNFSKHQ